MSSSLAAVLLFDAINIALPQNYQQVLLPNVFSHHLSSPKVASVASEVLERAKPSLWLFLTMKTENLMLVTQMVRDLRSKHEAIMLQKLNIMLLSSTPKIPYYNNLVSVDKDFFYC